MTLRRRSVARGVRAIRIDGESMTLEQVESIAAGASCVLAPSARSRVRRTRRTVETLLRSGQKIYGVNTGFGKLADVRIDADRLDELQVNLVRSHAAGVGNPLRREVVRATLALRANCLCRGHSGLRLSTLEALLSLLELDICPIVPEQGSVGASGDLAPLAHIALALIGEGEVLHRGRRVPAELAWRRVKRRPVRLAPKEGLALVNGTQMMVAVGTLALLRAERLARIADVVGAMTLEALLGSHRAFRADLHATRPHPGQRQAAANLRRLLADSAIERSHIDCGRVQDSYSLRCMPQVHGAVRDGLAHVRRVIEIEINSSTDNPMLLGDTLVAGGNFHGQPVSLALDHLAIAVASLGTIAERRIERLLNPDLSALPPFLSHDAGLHSGFMMAHVTAAALVAENKILAHPASVDTIPTSAAKEDHVSMGAHAARKAEQVVTHIGLILAIEALCAAQALDLLAPLRAGSGVEAARRSFRRRVAHLDADRILSTEIERSRQTIESADWLAAIQRVSGPLA